MWTAQDRDIMRDVYLLVSHHPDPDRSEAYWNNLLQDMQRLWAKWNGHPLAEYFAFATVDYYEKVLLERDKNGKDKEG